MEKMGVISLIQEPKERCTGMVPVLKKNGQGRTRVNLTPLNKRVKRELYPLPEVGCIMMQLAGAEVFSKLDTNSGFY